MLRTTATTTEALDSTVSTLVHGIDILHINPDVFCIDKLRRCMSDESSVFLRGKGASRLARLRRPSTLAAILAPEYATCCAAFCAARQPAFHPHLINFSPPSEGRSLKKKGNTFRNCGNWFDKASRSAGSNIHIDSSQQARAVETSTPRIRIRRRRDRRRVYVVDSSGQTESRNWAGRCCQARATCRDLERRGGRPS